MKTFCCTAQFVAALLLSGCGTVELFGTYDLPESAEVSAADYPRLVDTPENLTPGTYSAAVPDPADGAAAQTDLSARAIAAESRAQALAEPVLSDAERRRLIRVPKARPVQ